MLGLLAACGRSGTGEANTQRHRVTSPVAELAGAADSAGKNDRVVKANEMPAVAAFDANHASGANAGACTLPEVPMRVTSAGRVVAIGDVHGDIDAARDALVAAKVVDRQGVWIGGTTVVVQTGDILDRGDTEQAAIDWFESLERQAAQAGGRFISLIGNHELMNAAGDFRYVTPGGFADFDDVAGLDTKGLAFAEIPQKARARVAALSPGGPYAKVFGAHNVVMIVDDIVYSHAGVVGPWVTQLESANRDARCWLDGQGALAKVPTVLVAQDGPVWTRALAGADIDCAATAAVMRKLGVTRMVLGHTVQPGGISSACNETVWRIDVGLARNYQGPIEALELSVGKTPLVIKGTRSSP